MRLLNEHNLLENDLLYQQYRKIKHERRMSQINQVHAVSKVQYLEKEKNSFRQKIQQYHKEIDMSQNRHVNSLLEKQRANSARVIREEELIQQKLKNKKIKEAINYTSVHWKNLVKQKHEIEANKTRLIKLECIDQKKKMEEKDANKKKEKYIKIRKERAASAQKREEYQVNIKELRRRELLRKIQREKDTRDQYDSVIQEFKEKEKEIEIKLLELTQRDDPRIITQRYGYTLDIDNLW